VTTEADIGTMQPRNANINWKLGEAVKDSSLGPLEGL
jgi:hypothetical protein